MFRAFTSYTLASMAPGLVGILLFPLFTNYLSLADFGDRAIVLLAFIFFEILSSLGINWVIRSKFHQLSTKEELQQYISSLLIFTLIINLFLGLIFFSMDKMFFSYFFKGWSPYLAGLLTIKIIAMVVSFSRNLVIPILVLEESPIKYSILVLGTYITNISSAVILLIFYEYGISALFYGELIGSVYFFIISFCFIYRYITFDMKIRSTFRDIVTIGLPSMPKNTFSLAQRNVNKFVLQMYLPITDLGIFQRSEFLYGIFNVFHKSIGNTVASKNLKNLTENKIDTLSSNIVHQALYFLSILIIITIFFLEDIFRFVHVNEEFWICAKYAPMFGYNVLISGFTILYTHSILVSKRTYIFTLNALISFILSLFLNIALVSKFGIIGAIVSSTFVFLFAALFQIIYCNKYIKMDINMNFQIWFLMLISVILLYIFSYQHQINTVSMKLVILVIYFSLLLLFDRYFVKAINWNNLRKLLSYN